MLSQLTVSSRCMQHRPTSSLAGGARSERVGFPGRLRCVRIPKRGDGVMKSVTESREAAPWLSSEATEVAFPLGGIGTGTILSEHAGTCETSRSGTCRGRAWRCPTRSLPSGRRQRAWCVTRVLEGRVPPPHSASHGIHPNNQGGLPRFAGCRFRGRYPVAEVQLRDSGVPLEVDLLTYAPLVPLDAEDSGLPCIVFRWRLANPGPVPVAAIAVGTLLNPAGYAGCDSFGNLLSNPLGDPENRQCETDRVRGIYFAGPPMDPADLAFGNAVLVTPEGETTSKPARLRGERTGSSALQRVQCIAGIERHGRREATAEAFMVRSQRPATGTNPDSIIGPEAVVPHLPERAALAGREGALYRTCTSREQSLPPPWRQSRLSRGGCACDAP